ncbi:eCIS core domain-containing protein [Aeromonas piscicola]
MSTYRDVKIYDFYFSEETKMVNIRSIVYLMLIFTSVGSKASWLSEITGVDIDLNRGTVSVNPPNLGAIPQMIQNLPKDVGQAMLNPASPIVATAIRFSRGQAINRGVQPIPNAIRQELAPYFPSQILDKVRWTTADGISLDGALANWFNQEGAITYDEIIVFANSQLINDVELWAHELTHVIQYSQMGVETFAFQYTMDWNGLENQAKVNASQVTASINSTRSGQPQTWGYEGQPVSASNRVTWAEVNNAAKLAIPPQQCIWINNQTNTTGNNCPVPIMVSGVVLRRLNDGYTFTFPCNEPTCLFQPSQRGPLLSPPGHLVIGVTAAYEW